MDHYRVCPDCRVHVKAHEDQCPFCGARRLSRTPTERGVPVRLSRAQWLAFGSTLAVTGCSSAVVSSIERSSSSSASSTASSDVVSTTSTPIVTGTSFTSASPTTTYATASTTPASCGVPTGQFLCDPSNNQGTGDAGVACDRQGEFCSLWPGTQGCIAKADAGTFPAACLTCPTCDCINAHTSCRCVALDDAGAIGISCGGCYGSPPARLERYAERVG